jgi:hypothetical protein
LQLIYKVFNESDFFVVLKSTSTCLKTKHVYPHSHLTVVKYGIWLTHVLITGVSYYSKKRNKDINMTRFATPETVACPYCNHYYSRKVLCSFNNNWEVTYSDGGSSEGLADVLMDNTRCTQCCRIICDVQQLPALSVVPAGPFWKSWFIKMPEYIFLPQATSDVYFELFERSADEDKKMQYALQAYRLFNRTHRLEDKNIQPAITVQQKYKAVADHILASPLNNSLPEYSLLCADIYRLRGEFRLAKKMYDTVSNKEFDDLVAQGKSWCDAGNTSLMVNNSKTLSKEAE